MIFMFRFWVLGCLSHGFICFTSILWGLVGKKVGLIVSFFRRYHSVDLRTVYVLVAQHEFSVYFSITCVFVLTSFYGFYYYYIDPRRRGNNFIHTPIEYTEGDNNVLGNTVHAVRSKKGQKCKKMGIKAKR